MTKLVGPAALGLVVLAAFVAPSAHAAPPGVNTVGSATAGMREVTLPTGEHLELGTAPDGRRSVVALPSGRREAYSVRTVDGDTYVIPSIAQPFLGRGLDPALFDVSGLVRSGGTASRVPVRFTGAKPAAVTRSSAGLGYLSDAAATSLGSALARRIGAAVANGWRTQPTLPAELASLRSAGGQPAGGAPTAHPDYEMWTVKVRVLDSDGKPAPSARLVLLNTDDSSRYAGNPTLFGGTARLSLPAGNYSAMADVNDYDTSGGLTAVREVSVSDVAITKNTTLTLDSRTSTRVSAVTPRPTVTDDVTLYWRRTSSTGIGSEAQNLIGPGIAAFEAPSSYAKVGTLNFAAIFDLSSPESGASNYEYNLAFPADGAVPADQRYRPGAATLATLHARYFTDVPGRVAVASRVSMLPDDIVGSTFAQSFALPLSRTEYVTANPGVQWQDNVAPVNRATPMTDVPRAYPPGANDKVDWFRGPLVPGFGADAGASTSFACPACRNGNVLDLDLAPTVDSTPGHTEVPFQFGGVQTVAVTHLVLASGKTVLADDAHRLIEHVTVPAQPATYTLTVDETRQASWVKQSTASHTEWTFPDSAPSGTVLPPAWTCRNTAVACTVLPLLTVAYQLGGSTEGTAPPGADRLDVAIGHLPAAASVPVTTASVKVSFDDGATWTPTIFTNLGAGHYRARWTNPASVSGGDVALQVTARDAAGATLTQVVHHAYTITPAGGTR